MRVAYIGPPTARTGGPAGYLHELRHAAANHPGRHTLLFPPIAGASAPSSSSVRRSAWRPVRSALGRLKRLITGGPKFYRPSEADLRTENGVINQMMSRLRKVVLADAQTSVDAAEASGADVFFHQDPITAADHLENKRNGACWQFVHAPLPLVLYHAWCFGAPEKDWREFMAYPDVQRWIAWEVSVWDRVDRLLLPCREAGEGYVRVDERFAAPLGRAEYLPTGAGKPPRSPNRARDDLRRSFGFKPAEVVGLFLGNNQPYRGLDLLLNAAQMLPPAAGTGVVAVAGPPKESLPFNPRLRPLGRIDAVGDLLEAVDFVVNVNRFSLFDLSTIEALAAGKPLLLSPVGGNLTFHSWGAGAVMLDGLAPATIAQGLVKFFQMSPAERGALGQASMRCYEQSLTPLQFWRRHLDLYGSAERKLAPA